MRLQRIRIAPRKMRMVIDLVRGKKVALARDVLRFKTNKGARILSKLLDSAIATAKSLGQGDESNLMVLKIAVDEGPKLKRWRARAKGSAYEIQKKVSHITLILDEVKGAKSASVSRKEIKTGQEAVKKDQVAIKTEKPKFKAVSSELKTSRTEKGVQRFFRKSGEK
ncbi:MAG: 50S ribosomal protein L22 [bacterium]|nr:50S ribosomal protein L22 [bacterium]